MTRIELSQTEIRDIEDAMDDPSLSDKHRTKLLVIRMHSEGAKHGFIAKCLKLHSNTVTNYLKEWLDGGLVAVVDQIRLAREARIVRNDGVGGHLPRRCGDDVVESAFAFGTRR